MEAFTSSANGKYMYMYHVFVTIFVMLSSLDLTELPIELLRIVLSFLGVTDLCRASRVSRSWHFVVSSLDIVSWRKHFLSSINWRHPNWPLYDVYKFTV